MKKSPPKLAIATTAALVALGFTAPKAEAAGGERLIGYAHALEDTVVKINVEIREHYSHTSVFRHMLSDTHRLHCEAEHIDQLAHNPYTSLIQLRTDIIEVDKHVHHLHELVDAAERGRYGHVHGDTRHVHSLMNYMERLVHSMEVEVANLQRVQQQNSQFGHLSPFGHRGHSGHGATFSQGRQSSHGGHNVQHNRYNTHADPRNINNYLSNQWNRNSPRHVEPQRHQQQRTIRIDPRGLFNLFRIR